MIIYGSEKLVAEEYFIDPLQRRRQPSKPITVKNCARQVLFLIEVCCRIASLKEIIFACTHTVE
jgi:hypothetical protein